MEISDWKKIIPSENIPSDLNLRKANNNLDVIQYNNKYYIAFRNAPSHFASKKVKMIILSSNDMIKWEFEKEIKMNKNDLREPRFLVHKNVLFLYFFELGHTFYKFQPKRVHYSALDKNNTWCEPQDVQGLDNHLIWRFRTFNNKIYLSSSYGKFLNVKKVQEELCLYESMDGKTWKKISSTPQLTNPKSVCEGEYVFDKEGNIWGVARMEYDGSYTFKADKDSIHIWQKKYSEYKYDSSLMFEDKGDFFLIARRNLEGDGTFVKQKKHPWKNRIRYSLTKKRTALFKLDTINMNWNLVLDFKSTGDNCFPSLIKVKEGEYIIFNYSSDINKKEKSWLKGQLGKTYIYQATLKIN